MKEFKGTPGPWEMMMDGDEIKIIQTDSLENGIGCRSYIAICEEVQCIEDSKLIAAAPELLEALIKLVDIVDDMVHGPSTDAAHAAINKALGETK
jgi:hypothetical protein|nr:MAG TPA: hypothetical protein [Caudoviricetes sp.]